MNESLETQERIERYVLGEMSPAETARFESDLQADAGLASETEAFRQLRSDLQHLDEANFLKEMSAVHAEISAGGGQRGSRRWWAMAAVIVLLLIPTLLLWQPWKTGAEDLYGSYFSPYEDVTAMRAGEDPDFRRGMEAYRAGNYAQAQGPLTSFLAREPGDLTANFYGGLVEMEVGQLPLATQRLERVRGSENALREAATWYLALAHIKGGDRASARPLLTETAGGGGEFAEAAADLLAALD